MELDSMGVRKQRKLLNRNKQKLVESNYITCSKVVVNLLSQGFILRILTPFITKLLKRMIIENISCDLKINSSAIQFLNFVTITNTANRNHTDATNLKTPKHKSPLLQTAMTQ